MFDAYFHFSLCLSKDDELPHINVKHDNNLSAEKFTTQEVYEGFYNFEHQHCPHLVIFIIRYFDLI